MNVLIKTEAGYLRQDTLGAVDAPADAGVFEHAHAVTVGATFLARGYTVSLADTERERPDERRTAPLQPTMVDLRPGHVPQAREGWTPLFAPDQSKLVAVDHSKVVGWINANGQYESAEDAAQR